MLTKLFIWLTRLKYKRNAGGAENAFDSSFPLREYVWVLEDKRLTQLAGNNKEAVIAEAHIKGKRGWLHERIEYRHVIRSWKEAGIWVKAKNNTA